MVLLLNKEKYKHVNGFKLCIINQESEQFLIEVKSLQKEKSCVRLGAGLCLLESLGRFGTYDPRYKGGGLD